MFSKVVNIGKNSLKRHNFTVMAEKVMLRFKERKHAQSADAAKTWCRERGQPCETVMKALDPALWAEAESVAAEIERAGSAKLAALGLDLGGGGNYPLLYFLTRYLKARTVVETGVAAGWSSQAFLLALKANGGGMLYSSDFPYFRYENPEKLVGFVVDDALKANWRLFIEGDKFNLPQIVAQCGMIDLFHYDSDKSYAGRAYALETVLPSLSEKAVIIFDDIQDNFHFRDFVESRNLEYRVFIFEGKYVGMTGGLF